MYKHILIPVAPGHTGEYGPALAAARNLGGEGSTISVLTVMEEVPTYVEAYVPLSQLEANVEEALSELSESFKGEGVEPHVVKGHSANSILTWAENNGVDCIIISSHQPGFSDYFLGSTAARVVRHAKSAVLVLR